MEVAIIMSRYCTSHLMPILAPIIILTERAVSVYGPIPYRTNGSPVLWLLSLSVIPTLSPVIDL
jgi:hypothetical protein